MLVENMKIKGLHPRDLKLLPDGRGWLLVEFGGEDRKDSDNQARRLMDSLKHRTNAPDMKLYDDPGEEQLVWEIRESGLGATAWVPGEHVTWEGWEDSAVPPDKVGPYLRELCRLYGKHGYEGALYGHFGQGCIHTRITFDLLTAEGIANYRSFMDDATSLVVKYGGSLSGEHGDGQSKAEFLPKMFGAEICEAFREFKTLWDPDGKMNPGKIVDPYPITTNLRLGTTFAPKEPSTHFHFIDDERQLHPCGYAMRRHWRMPAAGKRHHVPQLSRHHGRTALHARTRPSAVRDDARRCDPRRMEKRRSVRGARPVPLLQGMQGRLSGQCRRGHLQGRISFALLREPAAAPLCLRDGLDPSLGAHCLARATRSRMLLANLPGAKRLAGIAPERKLPRFAPTTFKEWFGKRGSRNRGAPAVILWADTFNNYFHPESRHRPPRKYWKMQDSA